VSSLAAKVTRCWTEGAVALTTRFAAQCAVGELDRCGETQFSRAGGLMQPPRVFVSPKYNRCDGPRHFSKVPEDRKQDG